MHTYIHTYLGARMAASCSSSGFLRPRRPFFSSKSPTIHRIAASAAAPFASSLPPYVSALHPLRSNAPLALHRARSGSFFRHPWPPYPPNVSGILGARAINNASIPTLEASNSDVVESPDEEDQWKIKMLYDGDCPLCLREVNMLRKRNENYGTIKFIDISSANYSPEENSGIDFAMAMGRIHAVLRDGSVLYDIAAFKRLYEEVGLGWVYAFTRIKAIAIIADSVYAVWAKYRLQITGRPPLSQILKERERKVEETCGSDRCRIE